MREIAYDRAAAVSYAHVVSQSEVQPGDILQLGTWAGDFYHSPIITAVNPTILVAAHSDYKVLFGISPVPACSVLYGQIIKSCQQSFTSVITINVSIYRLC